MAKDNPFHVMRHHGVGMKSRWSVLLNNRPLIKLPIPLSRDVAYGIADLLNKSPRALIAARNFPLRKK